MRKFGYFLLAWFFPWLVFFMCGELGRAFVAFVLQASFLGWPFASVWAWRVLKEDFISDEPDTQSKVLNNPSEKR